MIVEDWDCVDEGEKYVFTGRGVGCDYYKNEIRMESKQTKYVNAPLVGVLLLVLVEADARI